MASGRGDPPTVALVGELDELCLRRVEGRWLLALFDARGDRIDVLNLDSPTANMYQAQRKTLVHGISWETENHAEGRVAQLYGGYLVPARHSTTCTLSSASGTPQRTGRTGPCSSAPTSPTKRRGAWISKPHPMRRNSPTAIRRTVRMRARIRRIWDARSAADVRTRCSKDRWSKRAWGVMARQDRGDR